MPDDASAPPRLSDADLRDFRSAVQEAEYDTEQEALDHALRLWREDREEHYRRLRLFLEHRMREAEEDAANGRLIPAEQVFAELRAKLKSEPAE